MTIKKPARAGLAALFFGALLGLFLTVSSYTPVHAQDQAPSPQEPFEPLARRLALRGGGPFDDVVGVRGER